MSLILHETDPSHISNNYGAYPSSTYLFTCPPAWDTVHSGNMLACFDALYALMYIHSPNFINCHFCYCILWENLYPGVYIGTACTNRALAGVYS